MKIDKREQTIEMIKNMLTLNKDPVSFGGNYDKLRLRAIDLLKELYAEDANPAFKISEDDIAKMSFQAAKISGRYDLIQVDDENKTITIDMNPKNPKENLFNEVAFSAIIKINVEVQMLQACKKGAIDHLYFADTAITQKERWEFLTGALYFAIGAKGTAQTLEFFNRDESIESKMAALTARVKMSEIVDAVKTIQ